MISISDRLRQARIESGHENAASAAEAFGWVYSTYAGHENGHRGIKTPDLEKYAAAFGVTLPWLVTGTGPMRDAEAAQRSGLPDGFAESAVRPFVPRSDTERHTFTRMAAALALDVRSVSLHEMTGQCLEFALRDGDLLVLDNHPSPAEGDLVVAQIADSETGEAVTRIARFVRGGVVLPYSDNLPVGDDFSIMATIRAVIRRRV